ncbi:PAS domain S-box protein [Scytonema sp. PCC 10023]|uniref:PAS domain S-box protein n=1 Tax=Scytonema sp. PCC 10023 TaxID=1680591 RepID=UPI0039C63551
MKESQRTIFIIDDCVEDRTAYRRYLEHLERSTTEHRQYSYQIVEFESAADAIERCQHSMPDLILLDFMLPDASGLEFIEELKLSTGRNLLPIVMLTGYGDESVAVEAMKSGAQDYLVKGKLTSQALNRCCHTVMERVRLMQQLEQQQEQQRLIATIALRIRQSLSLEIVLNTAVDEIRDFLKTDRVLVYQCPPDMSGTIVAESVLSGWNSCLNTTFEDTCFQNIRASDHHRRSGAVNDIYAAKLSDCYVQMLEQFQVKAILFVPIFCSTQLQEAEQSVWGLLVAHQCSAARQWQSWEIDLLEQLSVQLGIAIQQAQLYQNLQNLNTQLEVKVQERTAQLQQSERKFRAIFEQTFQFIGLLAPDGKVLELNQACLEFFSKKHDAAIGKFFWNLFCCHAPEAHRGLRRAIAQAALGYCTHCEVKVPNGQCVLRTVDFSFKPILNNTGQVVWLLLEGRDITERKQVEEDLCQLNQELEARVIQRTSDLEQANAKLRSEIAQRQRIEDELRQSEQKFRQLAENIREVFFIYNHDLSELIYISPAYEEIWGRSCSSLYQNPASWFELVHPEDKDTVLQDVNRSINIEGFKHEYRIIRGDGEIRWICTRSFYVRDDALEVQRVVGLAEDITERKIREAELRETNALLQAIIQSAPVAIDLIDPEGNIVLWNPMCERILGWNEQEVLGKPLPIIPLEEHGKFLEFMHQTLAGDGLIQVETHRLRKDGSIVDISLSTALVRDTQGKIIGGIGISQDISERKQAELELIRNRDLREAIFNESADAIFLVDADTLLIIDCNRRAVELFEASSKEELINIRGSTLQRYPFTAEDIEKILEEIKIKGFWSQEIEYVTRKGNFFWGHLASKQISVAGKVHRLIRVSDISERKQTVEQLQHSLEEKETLLKEIHHRVKNNLQIISSLLRMQSRRAQDQATMILFQESQNRVQSMALIHEHLYQSPELSQIDFGQYIHSLTNNLFRCYGMSQKTIALKIETNGIKLSLDTAIPCGLLINELVSNSLKYAFPNDKSGKIIIRLVPETDNTITLTVGDSGIGIPETLDWQNTSSLGLRIVHNLTKQLKGNILLERDRGTTFHITFPRALKP